MWHVKWTVRYVFVWIAMIVLSDWQLLYRFNFPSIVPFTVLTLAQIWLIIGLIEFWQRPIE